MKYRKKQTVEALQWLGWVSGDIDKWQSFMGDTFSSRCVVREGEAGKEAVIMSRSGPQVAYRGDWVLKHGENNFSVCNCDVFEEAYELVED